MACRWPAEAPLSEVRRYACGGSSPPPWVPCPLPPHLSAQQGGAYPPCWAQSMNPRIHDAIVTYTPTLGALHKWKDPSSKSPPSNRLTVDTRQPSFGLVIAAFSAAWRTSPHGFSSYLPTVWLASCLIRLNCFFILRVSVLLPDGRATSRISLIEWSQISALIYGRRQGSVLQHPVSGAIDTKSSPFLPMSTAYLCQTLCSDAQKMLDRFLFFSPPRLTAHWRHDVPRACIVGNEVTLSIFYEKATKRTLSVNLGFRH